MSPTATPTNSGGAVPSTVIDSTGNVGVTTSIAIDSNGYKHISYLDGTNDDLKYATDKTGSWVTVSVDTTGNVGIYTSIAIDSNDALHISYYDDTNDDLKYATCSSGCTIASNWDIVPLTQQELWGITPQSPLIPTMHCTFPTTMIPMTTSSMPPVQAAAQPRAIGTRSPLAQQDMWGVSLQSPSIPTMLSTFPTLMLPITTSSMPPVQAAAQPRAIGTKSPLTQQGLWGITPQSPLIPTMHCTFPTTSLPMTTSKYATCSSGVQLQAIGTRSPLTQQEMWGITPQSPLIPTMLSTFPT